MGFSLLSSKYYTRWHSEHETTVTDDTIALTHQLLQHAGFEKVVFYDRETPLARIEYMQWAKDDRKLFFVLFKRDGTPIALCWLTEPSATGSQSFAHFATLGTATPAECMEAGRQLIRFIGELTTIRQLIGITPMVYRHALQFAYGLGFKKLTKLEKAVNCLGKSRDAILSICDIASVEV